MQIDFHYYATYCAAIIAGYTHEESLAIGYSAQLVDECSRTFLKTVHGPYSAATTQLQLELMDARTDSVGLQDITRIWASFHFLPADLQAEHKKCSKRYLNKYRLICGPNGDLVVDTVELARGGGLQAAGIAMHVLADTWAHRYFAGTPSLVINNTNEHFYEIRSEEGHLVERKIDFRHSPSEPDDLEAGIYTNSVAQGGENSIMNLGHGRAGHLPDYSFMRYRYLPAWGGYREVVKNNPSDYLHAFCQMVYALRCLREGGGTEESPRSKAAAIPVGALRAVSEIRAELPAFAKDTYEIDLVLPWEKEIKDILVRRQLDASEDWKAFGEKLSGQAIEAFDPNRYKEEFVSAPADRRDETFLGKFFLAALAQKSMVTNRIYASGNRLAGISVSKTKADPKEGKK